MHVVRNKQITCHASKRLLQRYGRKPTDLLLINGILSRIHDGKGKLLKHLGSSGRMIFRVKYRHVYEVIVNKEINTIITFLPLNSREALESGAAHIQGAKHE